MLVFSRKVGEEVVIALDAETAQALAAQGGGTVVVHLAAIKGNRARVGIEAPKVVPVHRREIFDRKAV